MATALAFWVSPVLAAGGGWNGNSGGALRTTAGADLVAEIRKVSVALRLGWQHETTDTARPMTVSFAGAPDNGFAVFAATPQRDSAVLGLAGNAQVAEAVQLYARYDGEMGGGTDNHALTIGLRMTC